MKSTLFSFPEYAEIDGEKYPINTDYRVAIQCNEISKDNSIDLLEKGMAIIYLLFGEKGLNDVNHYEELSEKASYYLKCGQVDDEKDDNKNDELDFDFIQDYPYIVASFKSDYNGLDITKEHIHWWEFFAMFSGLSQSELGNCCILNKIRDLRNRDLSKIKDYEEREKVRKAQERFALKKKEKTFTEEEQRNMEEFYNS